MMWNIRWRLANAALMLSFWLMPRSKAKSEYIDAVLAVTENIIDTVEKSHEV